MNEQEQKNESFAKQVCDPVTIDWDAWMKKHHVKLKSTSDQEKEEK